MQNFSNTTKTKSINPRGLADATEWGVPAQSRKGKHSKAASVSKARQGKCVAKWLTALAMCEVDE